MEASTAKVLRPMCLLPPRALSPKQKRPDGANRDDRQLATGKPMPHSCGYFHSPPYKSLLGDWGRTREVRSVPWWLPEWQGAKGTSLAAASRGLTVPMGSGSIMGYSGRLKVTATPALLSGVTGDIQVFQDHPSRGECSGSAPYSLRGS